MLNSSGADRSACSGGDAPVSPGERLAELFVSRLARLVSLEQQWRQHIDGPTPRLLSHALYSTYTDCVRLGRRAEAQRILGITLPAQTS